MRVLGHLFTNNRAWADEIRAREPEFFDRQAEQQSPKYLWIGCSDSRVPANQIVGLSAGDMFVHRNIANVVVHSDLNSLSVLQYGVEALQVGHVIVCGHYGCGGVQAALDNGRLGLIDNWLRHVQDVQHKHLDHLARLEGEHRFRRLCELNVVEQVVNVCRTTVVQEAWGRGQEVTIHGWIYDLADGSLGDVGMCISGPTDLSSCYAEAVARPGQPRAVTEG